LSAAHEPRHESKNAPTIGVLLVNLGTPEATDYWSLRRYLKEFLSDPRVIETPRLIWWPILNLVILTLRPTRSAKAYRSIWNRERNESPLKTITRAQAEKLAALAESGALGGTKGAIRVDWAMRYGHPAIAPALARMVEAGCDRVLVVPLYPQYAAATTASVGDAVFAALARMRLQPALRIAPPYWAEPAYIEALAASLRKFLAGLDFAPDVILASFHGIPQAYVDRGDPYSRHCEGTFRLLGQALGLDAKTFRMTYQSRFGRGKWLEPATDVTVKALAREGCRNLVVITPGFSADCVETLEEIDGENRHFFLQSGGRNFATVPCLNASAEGMAVISAIVTRELKGWNSAIRAGSG
jgi:protoporphyrin/coproporphyrin ferrochelatase